MSLVINTDNTLVRDEFLFLLLCTHVIDVARNSINKRAQVWATNYNNKESIEWNSYAALTCFNIVLELLKVEIILVTNYFAIIKIFFKEPGNLIFERIKCALQSHLAGHYFFSLLRFPPAL